jgi:protein-disulfide isomerase
MNLRLLLPAMAGLMLLSACGESPSDVAFGNRVRKYLLEHPEVLQEAVTKLSEKEALAEAKAMKQAVADNRKAIERDPRDYVANPNGKITVTEFFDYNCAYCKVAAPSLVKLIASNPDIRFVFKEYPFQIPESEVATRAALVVKRQGGRSLSLYNDLLAQRPLNKAGIDSVLTTHGYDPAAIHAAGRDEEITKQIADVAALAHKLNITGTPAFVVGDRIVVGADMEELAAAIEAARKAAA